MDFTQQLQRIISICTGVRGIERGLELSGVPIQPVCYVEIEAFIIANLVAEMEKGLLAPAPIYTGVESFDANPFRGKIHGLIGGYPCTGESIAGLREGHKYKGFIWPYIRKIIATARPLWCFFENVDDHLTGTYPIVRRSLQNLGYAVEEGIYTAEEVGAPHERKRLFVLAVANPYICGYGTKSRELIEKGATIEDTTCGENGKWLWNEFRNGSPSMGNTMYKGLEGYGKDKKTQGWPAAVKSATSPRFPMSAGYEQYDWEEPRSIAREAEPSLGLSVNGYRFREDILRALGNMVIPITAAIAFKDLSKKHQLNH